MDKAGAVSVDVGARGVAPSIARDDVVLGGEGGGEVRARPRRVARRLRPETIFEGERWMGVG